MEIISQSSFDLTFDRTFQNLVSTGDSPVAADACRLPGVLLGWESHRGWTTYLFTGNADTDFDVTSAGEFEQAGAGRDTRRIGKDQLIVRAGGLTRPDKEVLKSILLSTRVYALAPDKTNTIKGVLVRVDTGTYATWRDSANRSTIEFKISFPTRKSFRA